jgi:hypothetical protein
MLARAHERTCRGRCYKLVRYDTNSRARTDHVKMKFCCDFLREVRQLVLLSKHHVPEGGDDRPLDGPLWDWAHTDDTTLNQSDPGSAG